MQHTEKLKLSIDLYMEMQEIKNYTKKCIVFATAPYEQHHVVTHTFGLNNLFLLNSVCDQGSKSTEYYWS